MPLTGRGKGFEVVILAGGKGTRLIDLGSSHEKALLPVGNRPMIYFPLKLVEKAGFSEAFVICPESIRTTIENLPAKYGMKLNLRCKGLRGESECGTADALRLIARTIAAPEIILISCDLISNVPLRKVVLKHLTNDSSLTALFTKFPAELDTASVPGRKGKLDKENDLIGMDEASGRLTFMTSRADVEDVYSIQKSALKAYPNVWMTTCLWDAHLYVMKKWLLDYLVASRSSFSMFKAEFVPHVVKKQFVTSWERGENCEDFGKGTASAIGGGDDSADFDTEPSSRKTEDSSEEDDDEESRRTRISSAGPNPQIFDFVLEDEGTGTVKELSSGWEWAENPLRKMLNLKNKIRCYAEMVETHKKEEPVGNQGASGDADHEEVAVEKEAHPLVIRSNNLVTYLMANFEAARLLKELSPGLEMVPSSARVAPRLRVQLAESCIIGDNCVIADKVTMKRTVLGPKSHIGDKTKIFNSVFMEECVVGDGSIINDCLIAEKAVIGEKCDLKNCIVGAEVRIPASTKAKNEIFGEAVES